MADFRAPTGDQLFALEVVADLTELSALPGFEDATPEMAEQILAESARLAEQGFAPLNAVGDREGARLVDGKVVLPDGFAEAYRDYAAAGWNGLAADPAHGGQGLPFALSVAVQEQFTAANMAFSLCPMLSLSAIEALQAHGDPAMQALYLPHLVTGDWTGAMQLTEPQAGSDVGALRSTATPAGDGTYRLKGQKIFITWGEHDLAENIVHMVLARLPDAPAGSKGVSLFLVPKYLLDAQGRHPWRPAHVHFMISASGYQQLVTHIFADGDQYLDSDVVFGVKDSLIRMFAARPAGVAPDGRILDAPFHHLNYDFGLTPA